MLLRFVVMAASFLFSANASAFDSPEHKRMGDLSYHIAMQTFCQKRDTPQLCAQYWETPSATALFFDPLKDGRAQALSYGDVVMCVDYFLTPEKLIGGREKEHLIRPAQTSLYPANRGELDLEVAERCNDRWTNFENARAGHVNHNHFQVEMLLAQRNNHAVALFLRAKEDKLLFAALVMNAISDHYLQDSFAPGHISTWRSRMSDVIANSYHDFNNRNGFEVSINIDELRGKVESAQLLHNVIVLISSGKGAEEFFKCDQVAWNCSGKPACGVSVPSRLAAIKSFVYQPVEKTSPTKLFKGDKQLWNCDQDIQRFVMLVSAVRSIHDVLMSQPKHGNVALILQDSFENNTWNWSFDEPDAKRSPQQPLLSAALPPSTIKAKIGLIDYRIERRFLDVGETNTPNRIDNRGVDSIFGISVGIDNMTFGDSQNRRVLGLEAVVDGLTLGHGFFSRPGDLGNFAMMAGVQGYTGPGPDGFGPTARFLMVMPATETSVSLQMRYLKIRPAGGAAEWHPTIGLRFDMGFTSFLTMYLQGGRDWAAQRDGTVRSGYSVGGGIQLGSAKCNIPGVKVFAGCP